MRVFREYIVLLGIMMGIFFGFCGDVVAEGGHGEGAPKKEEKKKKKSGGGPKTHAGKSEEGDKENKEKGKGEEKGKEKEKGAEKGKGGEKSKEGEKGGNKEEGKSAGEAEGKPGVVEPELEEKHEPKPDDVVVEKQDSDEYVLVDKEIVQLLDNVKGQPERSRGTILLNEARIANKQGDLGATVDEKLLFGKKKAEKLYLEALKFELTEDQQKAALLELAVLDKDVNQNAKIALVYEKYLEKFPNDTTRPQMLIQLGYIYREMGSYEMAIDKFYEVLDMSLGINKDQIPLYRYLSTKAQLEIADTYFITEEYDKAIKLFARMVHLEVTIDEREAINFKNAYAYYNIKDYKKSIDLIKDFLAVYPNSTFEAQSRFMLANSYRETNQPEQALEEVMILLKHKDPENFADKKNWILWKRKTANQLANDFYEKGDYISALSIYQTMAPLDSTPDWQWPIIYQIGRCFERLKMFPKAKESYEVIASGDDWKNVKFEMTDTSTTIKDNAAWRLTHLKWLESSEDHIKNVIGPSEEEKI